MKITINGAERDAAKVGLTVSALLEELGLTGQPVLVELNGQALFPREFPEATIEDGASLEIIRIAAGG